jgi:hypothetical protein
MTPATFESGLPVSNSVNFVDRISEISICGPIIVGSPSGYLCPSLNIPVHMCTKPCTAPSGRGERERWLPNRIRGVVRTRRHLQTTHSSPCHGLGYGSLHSIDGLKDERHSNTGSLAGSDGDRGDRTRTVGSRSCSLIRPAPKAPLPPNALLWLVETLLLSCDFVFRASCIVSVMDGEQSGFLKYDKQKGANSVRYIHILYSQKWR